MPDHSDHPRGAALRGRADFRRGAPVERDAERREILASVAAGRRRFRVATVSLPQGGTVGELAILAPTASGESKVRGTSYVYAREARSLAVELTALADRLELLDAGAA